MAGEKYTCPHCGHNIPVPFFGGFSMDADVGQAAGGLPDTKSRAAPPPDDGGEGFADMARQSMSKRIRVTCGKCGKGISVGARFAGKKAKCPACGTRILIPYPDGDQEKQLAAMKSIGDAEEFEQLDEEEVVEQDEGDTPVNLGPRASARTPAPFVASIEGPEAEPEPEPVVFPASAPARTAAPFVVPTPEPEDSTAAEPVDLGTPDAAPAGEAPGTPAMPKSGAAAQQTVKKRSPAMVGLLLLGLIVAVGVGVMIAKPELRHKVMASLGASGNPEPTNAPAPQPVQNVAPPVNVPTVKAEPPTIKVDSISTSLFAVDGYFPAPAEQVYVKIAITVSVPAKGEKLVLPSDGPYLAEGEKQFLSLGAVATGKTVVPVLSVKQAYSIEPGASQKLTLLFAVPSTLAHARLSVHPAEAMVDLPPAPKEPPAEAIVGTFVEKPPRNLQPLLRSPVMEALQGTPNQTLEVRQGKDGFDVSVPAAGVSGSVKAVRQGLYQGQLSAHDQTLMCKFRLAEEGKLLILYMSDEPFHQMTYQKK